MELYVIPPVSSLELMHHGKRYFCLAQLYKKHARYREFFQQRVAEGDWVTLDNGAGDHNMISAKDVLFIAQQLHPSEVIPPDIIFNGLQTIAELDPFIAELKSINSISPKKPIEVFGCPQGETQNEWLFVYKYMLAHPDVTTIGFSKIGIPKAFFNVIGDKSIKEARHMAYDYLKAHKLIQKPIHLLGLGDPTELWMYKNDPLIRSNDSCNSIWSAMNGIDWTEQNFDRIPTPKDYFDRQITPLAYDTAISNIEWLTNMIS